VDVLTPDDSDDQKGEAEVEQLVRRRELENVTGAAADGAPLLVHARRTVAFRPFADLRRRRNELEYPRMPADTASADEAQQAVEIALRLIIAADGLLGQLSFFALPASG